MTLGEERTNCPCILTLPDDILYAILSKCSVKELGRLACTCRHIQRLVMHDSVWKKHLMTKTIIQTSHKEKRLSLRERYRLADNWNCGHAVEKRIIHHQVKLMPWMQVCDDVFWISYKNKIRCYRQKANGRLKEDAAKCLYSNAGVTDVGRFRAKQGRVVAGYCDGSVRVFYTDSGECAQEVRAAHHSDVHAVDFHHSTIVSGSRDKTVKVWNMEGASTRDSFKYAINIQDRIWSLSVSPTGASFVVGSAGLHQVSPLHMYHTESGSLLCRLGSEHRNGAGVLDLQHQSPHLLYSCGYDTLIRLWDLRTPCDKCVRCWEEPFDSTVCCIRADGQHALVAGTARYGMVRLWDTRMTQSVQMYYCGGRVSSPVYSLEYDTARLYVALDKGINMVDFSV